MMHHSIQPFSLQPIAVPRPWGGNRANRVADLSRAARQGREPTGEWWLLSCRGDLVSRVAGGEFDGVLLIELMEKFGPSLLGRHAARWTERFPLLIKILDASSPLSVQVHPDENQAPGQGKTETWLVLDREESASIYLGVKDDMPTDELLEAIESGASPVPWLGNYPVDPGAVVHLPSGLIHALGAGLVVLEVQENSDTTYRIYDWDRKPPRPLHLQEAKAAISATQDALFPSPRRIPNSSFPREELVRCDSYAVEKLWFAGEVKIEAEDDAFEALVPLGDGLRVLAGGEPVGALRGNAVLVPAVTDCYHLQCDGDVEVLRIRPGQGVT